MKRKVGILIFDNAEVLDFCGPFEVFSVTSEINNYELFDVFTISKTTAPISAVNGLSVNPKYSIADAPSPDILIISGGDGTNQLVEDEEVLRWVQKVHQTTEYTISICSGARILGKLGLLDGRKYATHHLVYDALAKIAPLGIPDKDARFCDTGKILTSGGISAGIDLSFYMVKKLFGAQIMQKTADYMEYHLNEFA